MKRPFDSVEWHFIFSCLNKFGFKNDFTNWIKILYNQPKAAIKLNGYISEYFSLGRGIRQGCPVSAMLFILCTEILCRHFICDTTVKGIVCKLDNERINVKISQYADDTVLFFKNYDDVTNGLRIVSEYSQHAGPKLNLDKSEGLLLGHLQKQEAPKLGFEWNVTSVRYLGIHIGHNAELCYQKNWQDKIKNLQKLLRSWQHRNLTLFGKIIVLKALALPKLVYSATLLPIPNNVIKDITKICYSYLWIKERVRRNTIIGDLEEGGANMLDVESHFKALKANWVSRILLSNDRLWAVFARFYCNYFGKDYLVLNMSFKNVAMFPAIKAIPEFYQEIIIYYNECKTPLRLNESNIHDQLLWG